ncbi:MAG: hypothetical protein L6M37_00090 [Candidatus Methylarchaceae archaeon HK02M1]|nr:hypothetical protein [Candidatus Methylarchaceae archaeon HK02M1]
MIEPLVLLTGILAGATIVYAFYAGMQAKILRDQIPILKEQNITLQNQVKNLRNQIILQLYEIMDKKDFPLHNQESFEYMIDEMRDEMFDYID